MSHVADGAEPGPEADIRPQPADDEGELRQEIERTRERLGETVEQLAAKADVKGRVQAKITGLSGQAKSLTSRAASQAGAQVAQRRGQLAARATNVRQKSAGVGSTAKSGWQARTASVRETGTEPLRRTVAKGAGVVRQRPVPVGLAAVAMATGYLALRWWRTR
jgi:cobalamin biosynthesis Mg chelatase CobN